MPAAMIHLLAARDYDPAGDARFLLGCIAPDYAHERAFKDAIHLRDTEDRPGALRALRKKLDLGDSYSLGWLLHLYTDLRWDASYFKDYKEAHETEEDWFRGYHRELHAAGYALYHRYPWAEGVCDAILKVDLASLPSTLPADAGDMEEFRTILMEKTRESDPGISSLVFPVELVEAFARETAASFRRWLEEGA